MNHWCNAALLTFVVLSKVDVQPLNVSTSVENTRYHAGIHECESLFTRNRNKVGLVSKTGQLGEAG